MGENGAAVLQNEGDKQPENSSLCSSTNKRCVFTGRCFFLSNVIFQVSLFPVVSL